MPRRSNGSLKQPYGLMLEALSKSGSNVPAIMPKRIADTDPFKNITDATGSGPFIFVKDEWRPGAKAVYVRNTKYVPRSEPTDGMAGAKIVHVDRLEWLTLGDPQAAVFALQEGEVDFIENTPVDLIPDLKKKGIRLQVTNTLGHQGMLRTNHLHPPFDNREGAARAALSARSASLSHGHVGRSGDVEDLLRVPHLRLARWRPRRASSPTSARRGTRRSGCSPKAGYKGETHRHPAADRHRVPVQRLAAAGPGSARRSAPRSRCSAWTSRPSRSAARTRSRRPRAAGTSMFTWWNGVSSSDPVGNVPLNANCDKAWPGWPCDAAHQKLLDDFPVITDPAAKKAQAEKIQLSAMQLVPYVPVGMWFQPVAFSPKLSGLLPVPGAMVFWNAKKAEK